MDRFEEEMGFRMTCAIRQTDRPTDIGNIPQSIRGMV